MKAAEQMKERKKNCHPRRALTSTGNERNCHLLSLYCHLFKNPSYSVYTWVLYILSLLSPLLWGGELYFLDKGEGGDNGDNSPLTLTSIEKNRHLHYHYCQLEVDNFGNSGFSQARERKMPKEKTVHPKPLSKCSNSATLMCAAHSDQSTLYALVNLQVSAKFGIRKKI